MNDENKSTKGPCNAQLYAAAPDLLAAAEQARAELLAAPGFMTPERESAVDALDKAIAKAGPAAAVTDRPSLYLEESN